jgi:hypothetical protein
MPIPIKIASRVLFMLWRSFQYGCAFGKHNHAEGAPGSQEQLAQQRGENSDANEADCIAPTCPLLFSAVQVLRGHTQDSFASIRRLCYTEPT